MNRSDMLVRSVKAERSQFGQSASGRTGSQNRPPRFEECFVRMLCPSSHLRHMLSLRLLSGPYLRAALRAADCRRIDRQLQLFVPVTLLLLGKEKLPVACPASNSGVGVPERRAIGIVRVVLRPVGRNRIRQHARHPPGVVVRPDDLRPCCGQNVHETPLWRWRQLLLLCHGCAV